VPEHPIRFRSATVPFSLQSWTDSALAHFSGTAFYERSFKVPQSLAGKELLLDLGKVGVAAEVWVNGQEAGQRAWRPFVFDITTQAHAGDNALKIRVANSDAGWQSQGDTIYPRGSWGLHYQTELDRVPTIRPNGLEGPVRLLTVP
jgi:beta-galactosidase/beta-glucuronidase